MVLCYSPSTPTFVLLGPLYTQATSICVACFLVRSSLSTTWAWDFVRRLGGGAGWGFHAHTCIRVTRRWLTDDNFARIRFTDASVIVRELSITGHIHPRVRTYKPCNFLAEEPRVPAIVRRRLKWSSSMGIYNGELQWTQRASEWNVRTR